MKILFPAYVDLKVLRLYCQHYLSPNRATINTNICWIMYLVTKLKLSLTGLLNDLNSLSSIPMKNYGDAVNR